MAEFFHYYKFPVVSTILGLLLAAWYGVSNDAIGLYNALYITITLGIVEISFSFENSILSAKYVGQLSPFWQKIFLTMGILIAVFVVRTLFPILIVSLTTGLGLMETVDLALNDKPTYANHVTNAGQMIAAFGGFFLFILYTSFIYNHERELHWFGWLERKTQIFGRIAKLGLIDGASLATSFGVLGLIYMFAPFTNAVEQSNVLIAGMIGIVSFVILHTIKDVLESFGGDDSGYVTGASVVYKTGVSAFVTFMFLEVLDSSLSIDGVVFTNDLILIGIGLGLIGAMWVRSSTIMFVDKGTLAEFPFLEHAATYGIGFLALTMLLKLFHIHIPEYLIAGGTVVVLAYGVYTSIQYNKLHPKED